MNPVKLPALFPPKNSQLASKRLAVRWFVAAVLAVCAIPGAAQGDPRPALDVPLLLGGAPDPSTSQAAWDPRLPVGALRRLIERPQPLEPPACSNSFPVCVHRGKQVAADKALGLLARMEGSYRRLVLGLGLPAAASDGARGSTASLDFYLREGASEFATATDAPSFGAFDRGSIFCSVGADEDRNFERLATLCVAEAAAARLDPGETPQARRAYATHVWWATGSPANEDLEAIDAQQLEPERAVVARDLGEHADGGALFFEYLDAVRSRSEPTTLSTALLALAGSSTPSGKVRWHNEPDMFDVLRSTVRYKRAAFAHLMSQFAVSRAFLGSRDDGRHLPSLRWAGEFGRVRFDWLIAYTSLPRRVATLRPVEPTGSVYLLVDLDGVALGETMAFQAEWEAPVVFSWTIVHLDGDGREQRRLELPFQEQSEKAEQRIVNLETARYLVIVGTNLGGVDLAHPFDPDVAPYEAHGATVYLARL